MKITDKKELSKKANALRIKTIEMLDKANSGHVGGPLGMADLFTAVYYNFVKINPQNPEDPERDYVVMSNGHACPIWYAVLDDLGFFPEGATENLRKIDSLLQGHPKVTMPGIENSSGPLGHGLSQAVGIALGLKMDGKANKVVCFTSDGEHQEGQLWEAVMSANKYGLDNLIVIVDKNGIQIEGTTDEIMPLGSLKEKYESFGWDAVEIDGNDFEHIVPTLALAEKYDRPLAIVAHTVAGKGVDYMEGKHKYHDWKGEEGDAERAIESIKKL